MLAHVAFDPITLRGNAKHLSRNLRENAHRECGISQFLRATSERRIVGRFSRLKRFLHITHVLSLRVVWF